MTEMAGVESEGRSWEAEACCWASRLSCSWACSRISCCRSNTRDDMAEQSYPDVGMELSKRRAVECRFLKSARFCDVTQFNPPKRPRLFPRYDLEAYPDDTATEGIFNSGPTKTVLTHHKIPVLKNTPTGNSVTGVSLKRISHSTENIQISDKMISINALHWMPVNFNP